MNNAFLIDAHDSVVTVTENVMAGMPVRFLYEGKERIVTAVNDIPKYHKMAVTDLKKGDPVFKYGEVIGRATQPVICGMHVHVHNISDLPEKEAAYEDTGI